MFLLIDNYDSFTYNLWHYLGELGATVEVRRNDALSVEEALDIGRQGLIISPGPCYPDQAGICLDLIAEAAGRLPIFGVCLGLQAIGQAFGARVTPAQSCMHGKTSPVSHTQQGVFAGLKSPFEATRYHSLSVARESVPDCLEITATAPDGEIMGLQHKQLPIYGVQFHPESIASEMGHEVLKNFLDQAA